MSAARRQLRALLGVALRMDLRARGPMRARFTTRVAPLVWMLVFYFLIGLTTGLSLTVPEVPLLVRLALVFSVTGTLVFFNILIEYQEILVAPADVEVLFWRPIASRTLFLARVLHVLTYVGLLTVALLAGPSLMLLVELPAHRGAALAAFWMGGLLQHLSITGFTLLLYGVLMRRVSAERFQDLLAHAQLVFSILVILGSQFVSAALPRLGEVASPAVVARVQLLPPAWYAAPTAMAAEGYEPRLLLLFGAGLLSFFLFGAYAVRRLAPAYQQVMERVGAASGPAVVVRRRPLQAAFASLLVRRPLARAGFDFFLANLRGDRKLRVALLPNVGVPLGLLLYALVSGQTADPYGPAAPGGGSRPEIGSLYMAAYMLGFLGITLRRLVTETPSWRAAWVFHAAPLRHFDDFYIGALWGVVYGLLLPGALLMAVVLMAVWRDGLHVVAHLALPTALAVLGLALAAGIDPAPPLSREPQRHARAREILVLGGAMLPLSVVAIVHAMLRRWPLVLVLVAAGVAGVALLVWEGVRRSLRAALLRRAFDG